MGGASRTGDVGRVRRSGAAGVMAGEKYERGASLKGARYLIGLKLK